MELWPSTGSAKDGQLMPQRHVLKGDRRRPAEEGAEERPETDHDHRHSLAGDIVRAESLSDQRGPEILEVQSG